MDFTLLELLRLTRRWWWLLLLCPIVAGGAAYAVGSSMTPLYKATATLLVEQSQTPGNIAYQDILASQQLTQTYSRLVTARPVLDEVAKQLGGGLSAQQLASSIDVAPINGTQLVSISVTDTSPERAALLANTVGKVFIDQRQAQQSQLSGSTRDDLQKSLDTVKSQIDDTSSRIATLQARPDASGNDVQTQLTQLQSQLSQYQSTYSNLLEVMQRMDLDVAQATTQLQLAEQAIVPSEPISPRVKLYSAVAALLGFAVAFGAIVVLGYLDDTVKTSDDVQRLTGKYALGMISALRAPEGVEALAFPQGSGTEAFRGLRTNLQFATAGRNVRAITVTSVEPGAGKTTTVANLGAVLAQLGQRVVLVDGDLRMPRLHTHFAGVNNRAGLSNRLLATQDENPAALLQNTESSGLSVLAAGALPPNPSEILSSDRLAVVLQHLESVADIVLVDVPPLAVSDPLVVARATDAIILVVRHGRTHTKTLARVIAELEQVGKPILGVVVNFARPSSQDGYYYSSPYTTAYDGPSPAAISRLPRLRRLFSRSQPAVSATDVER